MKIAAAVALGLFCGGPALACSGYPVGYHQSQADVVVAGKLSQANGSSQETITTRRVLKGTKQASYPVVWPLAAFDDECAFLYPVWRERGVYFLKIREDGRYDVLWAEKRWKMVR